MFSSGGKRPFDAIAQAEQAWQAGDSARAEKLFEVGIAAYDREEPDGLAFALGRCGAFLLAQGRRDEAARVLEQAIEQKTDIPAIWSDYLRIVEDRRDIDSFKRSVERMDASVRYHIEPAFLLAYARRADREGATIFAEQVARWIIERSARKGDKEGRWAAIGDLGRILERAGHLDQAVKLWRDAFDEGSCDPDTASRLSMHLERAKDYAGAMLVIREALTRHCRPVSTNHSANGSWRRTNLLRLLRVWEISMPSRRTGTRSGTPRYQTSAKRVGNSQFRSKEFKAAKNPTASLSFRRMHNVKR
jgi:tetratricopeptide (TPR) repeat protein